MTSHTHLMSGATDDGREDGAWSVVTGETGLAHSGAIVDDQCGYVFVTHVDCLVGGGGVMSSRESAENDKRKLIALIFVRKQ